MSIITKKKTTETYLQGLKNRPQNTENNCIRVVKHFTKFVKESQNLTPDQLCEELLIMKKQDEEEYINTLYSILQDFLDVMHKTLCGNTIKTYFTNLRGYLYHFGVRTNQQDVKMLIRFPKVLFEEKYPLSIKELRKIVDYYTRYPKRHAALLAQSSSGMRIGEVLNIKKSDLIFGDRISVYIKASGSKNNKGRTVFLSKECQTVLEKYIDYCSEDSLVFQSGNPQDEKTVTVSQNELNAVMNKMSAWVSGGNRGEEGEDESEHVEL